MPIIGDFQFKGGVKFPAGAAAALYTKPIESPETVVAGTSVDEGPAKVWDFNGHSERVAGIAVDLQGNIYTGSHDGTVRKINSAGSQVWSATGSANYVDNVAVDLQGNVYTAGYDYTVRKFDSNGQRQWYNSHHSDCVQDIAVDLQGTPYSSGDDGYVCKLNSNSGQYVWKKQIGTRYANRIATDAQGNVYVVYGPTCAIYKLDSNGSQIWMISIGGNYAYDISADLHGNVYAAVDKTVHKINSAGLQVWSCLIVKYIYGRAGGTALDVQGNVYSISAFDYTSRAICKINNSGSKVWETVPENTSASVAVDLNGNVYVGLTTGRLKKIFDGRIICTS